MVKGCWIEYRLQHCYNAASVPGLTGDLAGNGNFIIRPMIKRIHIDNYKCMSNFDLHFGDLTLLAGPNGCGKSTVFEVAQKLRDLIRNNKRVDQLFFAADIPRWSNNREHRFELEITRKEGGDYLYQLTIEHHHDKPLVRVIKENLFLNDRPLFASKNGDVQLYRDDHSEGPIFSVDWTQSGLAVVADRPDNTLLQEFRRQVHRLTIASLEPRQMLAVSDVEANTPEVSGKNFASWYRGRLQADPSRTVKVDDRLRDILPGFCGLKSMRQSTEHWELHVEFSSAEGKQNTYRFDALSDGQRALIVLYLLLFADDANRTLLLDEPDNYITLPELQPWLAELKDECGDELPQTVLISHHPETLDFLPDNTIWLTREPESHTRIAEMNNDTQLKVSELYAQGLAP